MFFSAAARSLAGSKKARVRRSGKTSTRAENKVTARALADALEQHIAVYGGNSTNLLAWAPGGGVETVGMAQPVNDMLVQSDGTHVELFPAWPTEEPASFRSLRVKGAFVVSAAWGGANAHAPHGVRIESHGQSKWCGLAVGAKSGATVRCSGSLRKNTPLDF